MINKKVLIFGVTGQDGSYLAEYLLDKDSKVYGASRLISRPAPQIAHDNYEGICCDITDASSVFRVIKSIKPDYIYNLSAQSNVGVSFNEPCHTWDVTAKGCLNILEAIRCESPSSRFFQASSSEMYSGNTTSRIYVDKDNGLAVTEDRFQDENTAFAPKNPYAVAKLAAHHMTQVYRSSYNLFTCCGIMFNHDSERRGENFVTRKITKYIGALINSKISKPLKLGNINISRDWGHAKDYIKGIYLMLNADKPSDYVLATGETHSLKEFLNTAFKRVNLDWCNHIEIDSSLYRPTDNPYSKGDYSKIHRVLGWKPEISFETMVYTMVDFDVKEAK